MLIQPYIHPPADRNRLIAPDPPSAVRRARQERAQVVGISPSWPSSSA
jgi:hypothetical protein